MAVSPNLPLLTLHMEIVGFYKTMVYLPKYSTIFIVAVILCTVCTGNSPFEDQQACQSLSIKSFMICFSHYTQIPGQYLDVIKYLSNSACLNLYGPLENAVFKHQQARRALSVKSFMIRFSHSTQIPGQYIDFITYAFEFSMPKPVWSSGKCCL
jgi:hypothetical protein